MKKLMLFIVLVGIYTSNAQFGVNNAIYTAADLNLGNYFGVDLSLNYVYKEKYSLKLAYTANIRKPKSQPADYSSGLIGIMFFGLANPYDQFENYQIGVGKIYKLNPAGTIRVNLNVGLGYSVLTEPENWTEVNNSFLTENYTWENHKYDTLSLMINPKIEFPFTRFYGFTLSPMVQISKDRAYFGIGFGQMIGLLRSRK